jgi:hypothetical protein
MAAAPFIANSRCVGELPVLIEHAIELQAQCTCDLLFSIV